MSLTKQLAVTVKSLVRQPALPLIIVLTLALGIGASTALFAYLTALLWPRLDAPESDRIVSVHVANDEAPRTATSYPDYLDVARSQNAVTQVSGFSVFGVSVSHDRTNSFFWAHAVSGSYFSLFGATPELGRLLAPADDEPGSENAVVLSHLAWKSRFGGDPGILGKQLRLNGKPFTVVGVTRPG